MTRCTIQLVDVTGEKPRHVRKLSLDLDAQVVLVELLETFVGHLVTRSSARRKPPIGAGIQRSDPVKDESEE